MLPVSGLSSLLQFAALYEAALATTQLPGCYRLRQVLSGAVHQPIRGIAQPARHMEEQQATDTRITSAPQEPVQQKPLVTPVVPYTPPKGVKKTFYKRKLPCPPATEFSSTEGRCSAMAVASCIRNAAELESCVL